MFLDSPRKEGELDTVIRWVFIRTYGAGLLMMAVITWYWYGELPSKGTLVGTAHCVAGAVTSIIIWK